MAFKVRVLEYKDTFGAMFEIYSGSLLFGVASTEEDRDQLRQEAVHFTAKKSGGTNALHRDQR